MKTKEQCPNTTLNNLITIIEDRHEDSTVVVKTMCELSIKLLQLECISSEHKEIEEYFLQILSAENSYSHAVKCIALCALKHPVHTNRGSSTEEGIANFEADTENKTVVAAVLKRLAGKSIKCCIQE